MREYNIRVDGDDSYATYTTPEVYIEVPYTDDTSEQEVQDTIDQILLDTILKTNIKDTIFRDDLYAEGQLIRQDHFTTTPEGQLILNELQLEFPNFDLVDFENIKDGVVGKFDGYREPYKHPSISLYTKAEGGLEGVSSYFNLPEVLPKITFVGFKFDLITKEISVKLGLAEYEDHLPELPASVSDTVPTFYGVSYSEDGVLGDWVCIYIHATPKRIADFCNLKGIKYPLPPEAHLECDVVVCWGFVFNRHTLEYGPLKGYARYNLEDETITPV